MHDEPESSGKEERYESKDNGADLALLLKPEASAFDALPSKSSSSAAPPAKPFKPSREKRTPFVQKLIKITQNGMIAYRGMPFKLQSLPQCKGRFKMCYSVVGRIRLIKGVPNTSIYVKLFRDDVLKKETSKAIEGYHATSLQHYRELVEQGFPVGRILNIETAERDGFTAVEIVTVFKPEEHWNESTQLADLTPQAKVYLKQLRELFRLSFERDSGILNDLQGNIGINSEGKLVLFDFTEFVEGNKKSYGFHMEARKQLKFFACGNRSIYQYLLSSLLYSNCPNAKSLYQQLNIDPEKRVIDFDDNFKAVILPPEPAAASSPA